MLGTFRSLVVLALLSMSAVFASGEARAATITWTGTSGDGLWHTAGNWDLARIPAPGDDVLIPNLPGTASVTHGANITDSVNSLACDEPFVMPTGRLTLAASSSFSNGLVLSNAVIDGAGNVTISGPGFDWQTGSFEGAGTLTISPGVTWIMSGINLSSLPGILRPLDNFGTLQITNNRGMTVGASGVFRNRSGGAVQWLNNGTIDCNGGFENQAGATFTRSAGAGLALLQGGTFGSAGTVNIQSGTLEFNFTTTTQNGSVNVSPGAVVSFGGSNATFASGSSLTVNGTLAFSSFSNVTLNPAMAALTLNAVTVTNGQLTVGPKVSIGSLFLGAGTLNGAGNVTVTNSLQWNDATLGGTGTFTIAPGVAWNNNGGAQTQRDVDNFGSGVIARAMRVISPAVFRNRAGATLDLRSDEFFDGFGTLVNDAGATLIRSTGAGTLTMQCGLLNSGTLRVLSGTLDLTGSLSNFSPGIFTLAGGTWELASTLRFNGAAIVNNAATIVMDGAGAVIRNTFSNTDALASLQTNTGAGSLTLKNGALLSTNLTFANAGAVTVGPGASVFTAQADYVQSSGSTTLVGGVLTTATGLRLNGGALAGSGTVNGFVVNAATVAPGQSPGSLTVNGDYTQTPAGMLQVELAGTTPGSEFDVLAVSGAAHLGGALQVSQIAPFAAALGDSFEILSAGTLAGSFATANLPLAVAGGCIAQVTRASAIRLLALEGPSILTPPAGQTVCAGDTVAFTVAVSGSASAFQWRKDNVDIPGATSSSLVLAPAAFADAGGYDVVITGACGPLTSLTATLTVNDCSDTLFVDVAATPGGDGQSWATAFSKLEDALAISETRYNFEIWVAGGTYITPATPFTLRKRNQLYGGFASGATQRSERDPVAHPTVLTGDVLGDDGPGFTNQGDNRCPIMMPATLLTEVDSTLALDGFTFRGGSGLNKGGGALRFRGSARIAHCIFTGNSASGGGAVMVTTTPGASFFDCTFEDNRARNQGGAYSGGGVFDHCRFLRNVSGLDGVGQGGAVYGNNPGSFTDCVFEGNRAYYRSYNGGSDLGHGSGGAVYAVAGSSGFTRCVFDGNHVSAYVPFDTRGGGGAFAIGGSAAASLVDCSFSGNSVSGGDSIAGGAVLVRSNGSVTMTYCRFIGNRADSSSVASGGAIAVTRAIQVELIQCELIRNSAPRSGGGIYSDEPSTLSLRSVTLAANSCAQPFAGGIQLGPNAGPISSRNSILFANTNGATLSDLQGAQFKTQAPPSVIVDLSYTSIEGLTGSLGGVGNTGANPLFADPDGADNVPGTLDDDFRLGPGSGCVDRGNNSIFLPGASTYDLAGMPRFVDVICRPDSGLGAAPQIDLGAYEFQGTSCEVTGVAGEAPSGAAFFVRAPYPNPSASGATIEFGLPAIGRATIEVLDLSGRRVAVLSDRTLAAGPQRIIWDGTGADRRRLRAGCYFVRVSAPGQRATRRLVILK